jgi:simple sugar transport system ATP-binding protein
MEKHIIELTGITVDFAGVRAIDNCNFTIESGEVRAVVGENGAGKSTLMKVISGVYSHYEGDIFIDGKNVRISSPNDAKNFGIETVYQEVDTALFPNLTVGENIMFNKMVYSMDKKIMINWSSINKASKKVLDELNLSINPNTLVSTLSIAEKQMVLIARAIQEDCRFLILDEPTAPLSSTEVEELFKVVRQLSDDKNVGVIFVSHRLSELFEICKTITVLRNGEMVVEKLDITPKLTINDIVTYMLGTSIDEIFPRKNTNIGGVLFEAKQLCDLEGKVNQVDITLGEGEIIGICGLVGAGKTELSKLLFGADKCRGGKMFIRGKEVDFKNTSISTNHKVALVPEERRKEGVFVTLDVISNLSIACIDNFLNAFIFTNIQKEVEHAKKHIKDMRIITSSPFKKVKNLSGGNQQKVAIGKWLAADADIYIMDEPTKGIDVGAKREIFDLIYGLADEKKGVIYISSEIKEILAVTERVYVMYNGRIQKELVTSDTNEQEIMFYATGGK